jgi:K+-transporting ATPase c subunit
LIHEHTSSADLGMLGDPGVNVLTLNLALDDAPSAGHATQ